MFNVSAYKAITSIIIYSSVTFGLNASEQKAKPLDQTLSASEQLAVSLTRINKQDKVFNAIITINPNAQQDAESLDARSADGEHQTSLGGMTILLKDNIDALGMPTTAGSLALSNNYPSQDAPSVAQLKAAGAIILGKTNLSEWANFRSEKSSSGWSPVGGQTVNAFDTTRSPCGSSSGSAVAVALDYVKVAIGTETHGSIVCPASSNGVVGFKPTHGIVSGDGIVPLATSQDTAGPIANTVENASLVLSAMVSPSAGNAQNIINGLQNLHRAPSLSGMRVGIMASTQGFDSRRDTLLDQAIKTLEHAGVTMVENIQLTSPDNFWDENYQLLQYEFRRDVNHYFLTRSYDPQGDDLGHMTLGKLIEFNQKHAQTELKHFDQSIFIKSQNIDLAEKQYLKIREQGHLVTRTNGLDSAFKKHKLDAIIGITGGPAWKIDHINGDSFFGPGMAGFPAVGGHPHITTPGGYIAGMPMGISFIGKRHQDHKLAQLVYRFTNK